MTIVMKAREAAQQVYEQVSHKVEQWKEKEVVPRLDTIIVEGDPASAYYAQAKQKAAERIGVAFHLHAFPPEANEEQLLELITQLNNNPVVHGIMLELPLPPHINTKRLEHAIKPSKDIDGITPHNQLATVTGEHGLYPATPQACIKLVKHFGYTLSGKNVTLVGRGQTVGLPLFHLLQHENATVTVCHSRTRHLVQHLDHAEIVFSAVGRAHMITETMVHSQLIIVDAGIKKLSDGTITGDVSPRVQGGVAAYSPVPGGVGTLTTAVLFENLMKAMSWQHDQEVY